VPEEISGFAAARNTNNTEGTQLSRKEAARLYSIGPVLQHEQLYHLARMQVETHTAATIEGAMTEHPVMVLWPNA
jgi:hypothetical protein